jgi:hypothetical protein
VQPRPLHGDSRSARKLRKASGTAMFNGVTLLIFAGLSGLYALVTLFDGFDWVAAVMAIGLGVLGFGELKGRRMLRACDLRAPARLGWNQIALMVLIIGYCAWQLVGAMGQPDMVSQAISESPELAQFINDPEMAAEADDLIHRATVLTYLIVIGATVIFQGGNAIYYFTRGKWMRTYIKETPSDALHHPGSGA